MRESQIDELLALLSESKPMKWQEAWNLAFATTKEHPYSWQAWYLLGRAAVLVAAFFPAARGTQWTFAENSLHRALALGPAKDMTDVFSWLAWAREGGGNFEGALEAAEKAFELDPSTQKRAKVADLCRAVGRLVESEQHFDVVLAGEPERLSVRFSRSFLMFRLGRYKEAWLGYQHRWQTREFLFTAKLSGQPDTTLPWWTGTPA